MGLKKIDICCPDMKGGKKKGKRKKIIQKEDLTEKLPMILDINRVPLSLAIITCFKKFQLIYQIALRILPKKWLLVCYSFNMRRHVITYVYSEQIK